MTELLASTELTPEQQGYGDAIERSANLLLDIVGDILDSSKIEAGRLELEARPLDLRGVLADTLGPLAAQARKKRIALTYSVGADVPVALVGDPVRLQQVVMNLVGNAVKFTDAGRIAVEVSREQDPGDALVLHFVVRDTGIGIPADKQRLIFDAFTQADASTTRRFGGTGLGLSIASKLVALMRGRIWVESEVGRGSVFHFTGHFGCARAPASKTPAARRPSPALDPHPRCILLAEDNAVNQVFMSRMLTKRGHSVTVVDNGRAALRALADGPFDVVLMDVHMPEMNGLEAAAAIRADEVGTGRRVPIIALTAHAMKGDRDACIAAGMDEYLSKPLRAADLFEALDRIADAGKTGEGAGAAPRATVGPSIAGP
jgi:CheY-like chemotaxis protein